MTSGTPAAAGRRAPPGGADASRPRQRALARVPARAPRPHPARQRLVLDLARADVPRWPTGSIRRATWRSPAPPTPRWRWPGVTAVGEFHYLHHGPGGAPYDDPNEMGRALIAAAARRRHPHHPDRRLLPARRRSASRRAGPSGASPTASAERLGGARRGAPRRGVGADRSGDPQRARGRPRRRGDRGRLGRASATARCMLTCPSRPPRTIRSSWKGSDARPTVVLAQTERTIGALHRGAHDPPGRLPTRPARWRGACAASARRPSTILPTASAGCARWRRRGLLSLGSDSHAVIDLFEEARAVELDERLASGERGHHAAAALMRAASEDGHACLGWPDAGRIAPGAGPT